MFIYKLKLAVRSLINDRLNSAINIFGMAAGMAVVILLAIYVQHELSYDKFNTKHDRIYRLLTAWEENGKRDVFDICIDITKGNFAEKVPEIEQITRLYKGWDGKITVGDKSFYNINYHFVDTNFHQVFTLQPIFRKNPNRFFDAPNSVIINESTAKKLFGTADAIGKELKIMGAPGYVATVVKDIPKTSHYNFDILIPLNISKGLNRMTSIEYITYVLLKKGMNTPDAINKVKQEYTSTLLNDFGQYEAKIEGVIQPLLDIHLNSKYGSRLGVQGSITAIYIQILLAILILAIAIINFINIITIKYSGKQSEIGVRKAVGATRTDLVFDFLGKSTLMAFVALIFGLIITELILPLFSQLMLRPLSIDYLHNPVLYIGLPILVVTVGFLAGIYPAISITRYSPATVIKGNIKGKKATLSQILLIFQFAISFLLITTVIVLHQQINFMKNTDLGFQPEQVIAITNLSRKQKQSYNTIKNELLKNPNIVNISGSHQIPIDGGSGQMFYLVGKDPNSAKSIDEYRVTPDFIKTLGATMLTGKEFEDGDADKYTILLNEKALELFNITDNPIGTQIMLHQRIYTIKGVFKNFNYESLHTGIAPLMLTKSNNMSCILIRTKNKDYKKRIAEIKAVFKKIDADNSVFYQFINDLCRNRYRRDERNQQIIVFASILSIILALLGLYAITLHTIQKRTKEIGVRKVNGATAWQINGMFMKIFMRWLIIAFVIATPIAWWIINRWLEQFAYRISIGIMPFILSAFVTMLFALAAVGYQTGKASRQNPVEALRYE